MPGVPPTPHPPTAWHRVRAASAAAPEARREGEFDLCAPAPAPAPGGKPRTASAGRAPEGARCAPAPAPGAGNPLAPQQTPGPGPRASGRPTTCCARRPPSASGSPGPGRAGGGPRLSLSRVGEGSERGRGGAGPPGPCGPRSSPGGGSLRLTRCPPPPVAAGEWGQVKPPNRCSPRPGRRHQPLRLLFIKLFCLVVRPVTRPRGRAPGLADSYR